MCNFTFLNLKILKSNKFLLNDGHKLVLKIFFLKLFYIVFLHFSIPLGVKYSFTINFLTYSKKMQWKSETINRANIIS